MVSFNKRYIYADYNFTCNNKVCTIKDIFVNVPKIYILRIKYNHKCIIDIEYIYEKDKYYFIIAWDYKSYSEMLLNVISEMPNITTLINGINWDGIVSLFNKSQFIHIYHMKNSFTNKYLNQITHISANNTEQCKVTSLKNIRIDILHRKLESILDMLYAMPLDTTNIGILFINKKYPDDVVLNLQIIDVIWKRLKEFTELKILQFRTYHGVVTTFIQNDNLLLNLKEFNTNFNFNVQYFIENSCVQRLYCNLCNVDQDIIKQSCLVECIGPNCEELQSILDNNCNKMRFIKTKVASH